MIHLIPRNPASSPYGWTVVGTLRDPHLKERPTLTYHRYLGVV